MIEKQLYECSFCGRTFLDRKMCEEHEKQHAKPAEIAKTEYVSDGYPHTIHIKMNDGAVIAYRHPKLVKRKENDHAAY